MGSISDAECNQAETVIRCHDGSGQPSRACLQSHLVANASTMPVVDCHQGQLVKECVLLTLQHKREVVPAQPSLSNTTMMQHIAHRGVTMGKARTPPNPAARARMTKGQACHRFVKASTVIEHHCCKPARRHAGKRLCLGTIVFVSCAKPGNMEHCRLQAVCTCCQDRVNQALQVHTSKPATDTKSPHT